MMSKASNGLRKIGFYVETVISKLRWSGLRVNGLFRKRRDTQIIIDEKGEMITGKDVLFQRNVSLSSVDEGTLRIGSGVSFNRNCIIICRNEITIEDDVIFGPGVTIYDHDHIFTAEGIKPGYNIGSVVIEKGC